MYQSKSLLIKTKLYLLALLLCAGSLLHAQRNSNLPKEYSSIFKPSSDRPQEWTARFYKSTASWLQKREALIRSAALEQLDSIVVEDGEKLEFVYDENGFLTSFIAYLDFFGMGYWEPFFRTEYVISSEGLLLQEITFIWSDNLNDWEAEYREDFTYLPDNNLNDRITYTWSAFLMEWIIGTRTVYTYLPDNRIDVEYYQEWNSVSEMWTIDARSIYNYDGMDRLEEILSSWYEPMFDEWFLFRRQAYQYDANDQIVEWGDFNWNETNNEWIPNERIDYSYNVKGELILRTIYYWYMVWTPGYRETFDYDDYGNMISTTFNGWDDGIGMFLPEDRTDFEYDTNTPVEDIFFPHIWDEEFVFNHKMVLIRLFSYDNGMWEEEAQADFYYSPIMTSIENMWDQDVSIYPNPASDHLVLKLPSTMTGGEVSLLQISGQPVLQQIISGDNTILPISNIPSGMYMLQYRSQQQGVVSRPLVIHR